MGNDVALRYAGGGSLTFGDGTHRRRHVLHGASFLVDQATAEILLQDPDVHPADEADVPRVTSPAGLVSINGGRPPEAEQTPPQIDVAKANKTALLEYAALLGLSIATRTKIANVRKKIEAELKHRQAIKAPLVDETAVAVGVESNQGGESSPADDSGAPSPDEAGTPPETASTGAVTLGDLPEGAKVKG